MRKVVYSVAMSLDGFISGPNGELDWITIDPDLDFNKVFERFDTMLVGRKTFTPMADAGRSTMPGMSTIVFSKTLSPDDYPEVAVARDNAEDVVESLKKKSGKDIWLYGGALLFQSLAIANLVDSVSVAVMPILLGSGIPLLPPTPQRIELALANQEVFEKTGTISLEYSVKRANIG